MNGYSNRVEGLNRNDFVNEDVSLNTSINRDVSQNFNINLSQSKNENSNLHEALVLNGSQQMKHQNNGNLLTYILFKFIMRFF